MTKPQQTIRPAKPCRICGCAEHTVLYHGPIRVGRFGNFSKEDATVWECGDCHAGMLDRPAINYQSKEYRELVDGSDAPQAYYEAHDQEQARKLAIVGSDKLRGKIVADIGCGGGSFLDLVQGMTDATIAVEPASGYRDELSDKGHNVYSLATDALEDWKQRVDLAVCFAVIEHIEKPVEFLKQIRELLAPGGRLLLSTPNRDDWLLTMLPDDYGRFFYRHVHTWYFSAPSLRRLALKAGFANMDAQFVQQYDLSNALLWLRDRRPTGMKQADALSALDGHYIEHLEQTGRSDYMYAWLTH